MSPPFRISPGSLSDAFDRMCARLDEIGFADALWGRRLDAWTTDRGVQEKIGNRLGWLSAIDAVTPHLARMRSLADSIRAERLTDVVLLGMGGSSLAPEVLRQVVGTAPDYPRFRMLDSVDPDAVRAAMENAPTSLFVLASKSGSTIEPNVMAAEARRRLIASGVPRWASRFVAITDENTALHHRAREEQFREIFVNPSDIGGRYSALSLFGMVPAALMGADVDALLSNARTMEAACRTTDVRANPGLALGAFMAAGASAGRDKLTLMLAPRLSAIGLWVEQLVAESTGKQGKGIVPIAFGAVPGLPLGSDSAVVAAYIAGGPHAKLLEPVRTSGVPCFEIEVPDVLSIGAEFLRWEVATATAGRLMDINPFDEPNVKQAKDATQFLLEQFTSTGRLPVREPHRTVDDARLTLSAAAERDLRGDAERFLRLLNAGDYFGLLAYLPPERDPFDSVLHEFQANVRHASGCATMFAYGPRYLHSTGQLHKGGANNGVFVIVTAAVQDDLPIPDEPFSFGVLEMAQALGDFESLEKEGRRALHVHLPTRDVTLLKKVFDRLLATKDTKS